MNILFFSVSIGAGHDSAARSLEQACLEIDPTAKTKIIDTFDYINPTLHKVVLGSYMETLRFSPRVWGYLYHQAEKGESMVEMGPIFSELLSYRLKHLLKSFQPDAIVCTHAFPTGIISLLREKEQITVPLITVVTDFTIHPYWIHPETDYFIIPTEKLVFDAEMKGVPREKIKPLGIPVRPQFARTLNKEEVRMKLGLDERPTVLVMGGGLGLGAVHETVATLLAISHEIQVLAVTGQNQKLFNQLDLLARQDDRLRVFGFVENVDEMMAAADLIVTKPGGLTTAEVLARQLPMVIVDPLPGQEDRNTEFLLNWGLAMKARQLEALPALISQLLQSELRLRQMREMAAHLAKPSAAADICQLISQAAAAYQANGVTVRPRRRLLSKSVLWKHEN